MIKLNLLVNFWDGRSNDVFLQLAAMTMVFCIQVKTVKNSLYRETVKETLKI